MLQRAHLSTASGFAGSRCDASWPVANAVPLLTMYTEVTKWLLMRVQDLQQGRGCLMKICREREARKLGTVHWEVAKTTRGEVHAPTCDQHASLQ